MSDPSVRDRVIECLRAARQAPRPGSLAEERLVERAVAAHLRGGADVPVEVVVLDLLGRGIAHRRVRPLDPVDLPGRPAPVSRRSAT